MISNAKRATTIVKMQTVMRPLSELAVGSLSFVLSFVSSGLYHPISTTGRTGRYRGGRSETTKPDQYSNHKMVER